MNNLINKLFNFYFFFKYLILNRHLKLNKIKPNHNLDKKLTISLTAKFERFNFLHLTLKSIINQSIQPDEIILWIEYEYKKKIPKKILELKKFGLQILFCKNFKSYNKIIHTLKLRKKNYIITFDDDIIYNNKAIEFLVKKAKKNKKSIVANRIHRIICNKKKYPISYVNWKWNYTSQERNKLNFQTGVYGVLYPPNSLHKDTTNQKKFMTLSPHADDIWLYWMIRLNRKFVIWSGFEEKNIETITYEKNNLRKLNISENHNDLQIKNLIKYYGLPY